MFYWIIGISAAAVAFLLWKVLLLYHSVKEIQMQIEEKLEQDTNTRITIAARDRKLRRFAVRINKELEELRRLQLKYLQGDQNLKMAVTNISHDLRTPLTVISAYLEIMERETDPAVLKDYLGIIRERTEELKQMTKELFSYTLFTGEQEEFCTEKTNLNRVLETVLSSYYAVFQGCRIQPRISLPEETVWCLGNERALQRIFDNVLNNAVKYSAGDLKVFMTEQGEISFSNRAPEMDATKAGRLLDRYFTLEQGTGSSGLGLSIARTLVERMQGEIAAEYERGELKIRIRLPLFCQITEK